MISKEKNYEERLVDNIVWLMDRTTFYHGSLPGGINEAPVALFQVPQSGNIPILYSTVRHGYEPELLLNLCKRALAKYYRKAWWRIVKRDMKFRENIRFLMKKVMIELKEKARFIV
jgi:hypothetical protein